VIRLSDSLLLNNTLNKSDKTEILMMKAVSHYVLAEEPQVRKCFIDMLKIDRHLELDTEKVSPKIVSLFNEVKNDFLQTVPEEQKTADKKSEVTGQINNNDLIKLDEQKSSIVRSFLFPGWGHLYSGNTIKGTIISSAALINLGSMIYFIIDANSKEKKYLNETDGNNIAGRYDSYNSSYKTRNILITTFIILYAYTQIDLLFLGGNESGNTSIGFGNFGSGANNSGITFLFKLPL
jgi:hypothetical protein